MDSKEIQNRLIMNELITLKKILLVLCLLLSSCITIKDGDISIKLIPDRPPKYTAYPVHEDSNSHEIKQVTRPLHIKGRYIMDDIGNKVILRGVQKGYCFLDHPGAGWMGEPGWDETRASEELDLMEEWGINVIRIHEALGHWVYNYENHRQAVRCLGELCAEKGLYLIIDGYSVVGDREQGYQQDTLPYPPYIERPDVIPDVEAWIRVWKEIAGSLQNLNNIILEPHNEPVGGEPGEWFLNFQKCLDEIRAVGFKGLVITQWWYGPRVDLDKPDDTKAKTLDWIEAYPLDDPEGNILYSTHQYRYHDQLGIYSKTHGAFLWPKPAWEKKEIRKAMELALIPHLLFTLDKPLIIGECGANIDYSGEELDRELTAWAAQLELYNEYELSYIAVFWRDIGWLRLITSDKEPGIPTASGRILMEALRN